MLKIYDSKDAVPEAQRESALALADGKFAVEEPTDPAMTEAGKKALQAERERADAAEKARKVAEKKAADLEREKDARSKGISEEALEEIRQKEAAARKPIEDERDQLAAENRKLKLTDRVQALYLANGGMPDRVEDAMLILDRRSDLGDKGGIVYKDKDGATVADDDATFFKKLKAEKPWLFKGSGGSGSGAEGSNGSTDEPPKVPQSTKEAKRRDVAGAL